jgi:hypothetical protein
MFAYRPTGAKMPEIQWFSGFLAEQKAQLRNRRLQVRLLQAAIPELIEHAGVVAHRQTPFAWGKHAFGLRGSVLGQSGVHPSARS